MTKFRWACVAVLLTLGALMFGACGGGDDGDDGGDEPQATEPAGGGDEPTEEADQAGGGGDAGDFKDAALAFVDATFRAEYDATFAAQGGGPSTFTIYKDGSGNFRFDASTEVDGQTMEFIVIAAGDTSGFCLTDAGGLGAFLGVAPGELGEILGVEPGEGICFANDPTMGGFDSFADEFENIEDEIGDAEGLPNREIAGKTVKCGRSIAVDDDTVEVCFTDDGALAYLKGADGTEFIATSISDDVSDSDFELPYEVKEFPGIGG